MLLPKQPFRRAQCVRIVAGTIAEQQLLQARVRKGKIAFRQLIRISGVGPRIALSVLSGMSVADLAQSVALQESARLQKVPGIGKKTAERLLLELEGKLAPAVGSAGHAAAADAGIDVLHALLALGYSEREATAAIRQLPAGAAVSDGIKQALKLLAKS